MTIEELYKELYGELLAWCTAMCGSAALAEDLVQEGFSRAIVNSDTVLPLRDMQQRSWLYRTIKNLYLNHIRHSAFETDAETLPETAKVSDEYGSFEIMQLLGALTNLEKTLFLMRYFQGYDSSELGRIFDMPAGTVRSKLSSARKKLRHMLRE